MGLEEGAFPRSFFPSTLEQLPSQSLSEEDRAIFLEAVSSAEEIFIMTYCRCHPEDGKEVRPSSVINEIVQDRGHIYTVHHPVSAFDLSYYQKEGFQSSSLYHQKITEAKLKKERISKETTLSLLNKKHEKERIYIRDLKKLARHPFQFYLEEGVGIQFPFDRNDSEFLFSRLEMARLRELCLHQPITSLIKKLEQEGKLPSGSFRDMAVQSIEEELLSYQQVIRVLNLDPSSFFSLELSPYCTKSMDISHGRKIVPSIKIQLEGGVTKEIVGVIDGLTNEGLVYHGEDSLENHLKLWPLYCLIQACLGQESHAIFLTKKGDICHKPLSNPLESLTRYLSYMEKCLRAPSPLLPEWGRRIFKESLIPDKSDDKIIDWASKRKLLPSCSIWLSHWKNDLHETFHELL
jgi:exonuclease V gamma subunit